MPAALKTPLLESDFAPDNSNSPRAATRRVAATSVSGASSGARVASAARVSARPAPRDDRRLDRDAAARVPDLSGSRTTQVGLSSVPASRVAQEAPAVRPRSRREARHRQFKPSITAMLCGCALMGQLVLLLWLHGNTLTAAREVEKVDAQIAEISNHIERTQERIAAFDSSPQVKMWAEQKNWKAASHPDIDDITKVDQARAMAQAEAQAALAQGEVSQGASE